MRKPRSFGVRHGVAIVCAIAGCLAACPVSPAQAGDEGRTAHAPVDTPAGAAGSAPQLGSGGSTTTTETPSSEGGAGGAGGSAASSPSHPRPKRRGGINPCMTPDPGWGVYDAWTGGLSLGQMAAPHRGGISKSGAFDVIIHFHGHEPIRKEFVKTAKGIVLVGVDLGIGSGAYSTAFAAPNVFPALIKSIEAEMAKRTGNPNAHVRKIGLSSWSAGYGAIEMILRQTGGKNIDAVVLLDSLHTGYIDEQNKTLKVGQIDPFIAFAKRAAAGDKLMYVSHSSIIPPGYASTSEVADFLVEQLHGKPHDAARQDVLGLDMYERYDRGGFHMRGYTGDDKPDHCAHIGLMADVVQRYLTPRWKSPKGRK